MHWTAQIMNCMSCSVFGVSFVDEMWMRDGWGGGRGEVMQRGLHLRKLIMLKLIQQTSDSCFLMKLILFAA